MTLRNIELSPLRQHYNFNLFLFGLQQTLSLFSIRTSNFYFNSDQQSHILLHAKKTLFLFRCQRILFDFWNGEYFYFRTSETDFYFEQVNTTTACRVSEFQKTWNTFLLRVLPRLRYFHRLTCIQKKLRVAIISKFL